MANSDVKWGYWGDKYEIILDCKYKQIDMMNY